MEPSKLFHDEKHSLLHFSIENNENVLKKLLRQQPYTSEDIILCAKSFLDEHHQEYDKQFILIENVEQMDEKFNVSQERKLPCFCIYGKRENCWILFCLIRDENQNLKILYKDPFSNAIDSALEEKIRSRMDVTEFIIHNPSYKSEEREIFYGPLTLRNLKIVLETLELDFENILKVFPRIHFSDPSDITIDRIGCILPLTMQVAQSEQYLTKLRDYVNKLPQSGDAETEHATVLPEEVTDTDCTYKLQIQNEFPEEMENTEILLQILQDLDSYNLVHSLTNICNYLNLDCCKLLRFFSQFDFNQKLSGFGNEEISEAKIAEVEAVEGVLDQIMLELETKLGLGSNDEEMSDAIEDSEDYGSGGSPTSQN